MLVAPGQVRVSVGAGSVAGHPAGRHAGIHRRLRTDRRVIDQAGRRRRHDGRAQRHEEPVDVRAAARQNGSGDFEQRLAGHTERPVESRVLLPRLVQTGRAARHIGREDATVARPANCPERVRGGRSCQAASGHHEGAGDRQPRQGDVGDPHGPRLVAAPHADDGQAQRRGGPGRHVQELRTSRREHVRVPGPVVGADTQPGHLSQRRVLVQDDGQRCQGPGLGKPELQPLADGPGQGRRPPARRHVTVEGGGGRVGRVPVDQGGGVRP